MHFPPFHRNGLTHVIKSLLAVICILYFVHPSIAQSYTRNDSVQIYTLLNQADEEALTGSLDTAMLYARHALQISKGKKMLRGEGFAHLKIADILVQQENTGNLTE